MRFAGKRALVTGGASGIGRATAVRLESEGAKVTVVDRVPVDGGVRADVGVEEEVERAVAETVERLGGLDVLVANAGVQLVGRDARADRLDQAVWDETLRINLTGAFLTCKYGIRALLDSGGGSVVCVSSPTALAGVAPGFDAYSASKAGIVGLVRSLAAGCARDGVRVNAVVPGLVDTPLVRDVLGHARWRADLLATIPLGRAASADEVAALIAFVASDECAYATGAVFVLDGGMTAV